MTPVTFYDSSVGLNLICENEIDADPRSPIQSSFPSQDVLSNDKILPSIVNQDAQRLAQTNLAPNGLGTASVSLDPKPQERANGSFMIYVHGFGM